MKDTRTQLEQILAERIAVLDGSWGVLERGGTLGSPASPLLTGRDSSTVECLSPGEARLRRSTAPTCEVA